MEATKEKICPPGQKNGIYPWIETEGSKLPRAQELIQLGPLVTWPKRPALRKADSP